jgi:hypothetical protein
MCQTSVKSQSTDDMSHLPKINQYNSHTFESFKMFNTFPRPDNMKQSCKNLPIQKDAFHGSDLHINKKHLRKKNSLLQTLLMHLLLSCVVSLQAHTPHSMIGCTLFHVSQCPKMSCACNPHHVTVTNHLSTIPFSCLLLIFGS